MTIRLVLACHAQTAALARVAFPAGEPLTERGLRETKAAAPLAGARGATWCGPAPSCVQTATALGLAPAVDPALRDCDFGRWRGRLLSDVELAEPSAVHTWLTDPVAAPHGGESLVDLLGRVRDWLAGQAQGRGQVIAVTNPAVIRAAVIQVLGAPALAFWRIDVPPLARVSLTGQGGVWTLRA